MSSATAMLDKCSNPACSATFRKLRDGRVFAIQVNAHYETSRIGRELQPHYFWLCDSCCRTMTIIAEKHGERIQVVPLPATVGSVAS